MPTTCFFRLLRCVPVSLCSGASPLLDSLVLTRRYLYTEPLSNPILHRLVNWGTLDPFKRRVILQDPGLHFPRTEPCPLSAYLTNTL